MVNDRVMAAYISVSLPLRRFGIGGATMPSVSSTEDAVVVVVGVGMEADD